MDHVDRINAIVSRAQTLNLTLAELCEEAGDGADYKLVWRWWREKNIPTIRKFGKVMRMLEETLDRLEADMHAALSERLAAPTTGVHA